MPRRRSTSKSARVPKLRRHDSGRGFVELAGRRIYFGDFDAPETREAYARTLAEHFAAATAPPAAPEDITVLEVLAAYWEHCERYYRDADGNPTGEIQAMRYALGTVRKLYGSTLARNFGPRPMLAVQAEFVRKGWARGYVNAQIRRVKRCFRWAAERGLVSPTVAHAVWCVSALKRGRTDARESAPIAPAPDRLVDAVLPHMTPTLRAAVEFMRHTGARVGETCRLRPGDIDMSAAVWQYRPATHKTAYLGYERVIFIGRNGQAAIRELLAETAVDGYVFSPARSEMERNAARHAARQTPLSCGNRPGSRAVERRGRPRRRPPKDRYDSAGLAAAVLAACRKAFPPPPELARRPAEHEHAWRRRLKAAGLLDALREWEREHSFAPGQLRHSFASRVRREHGLEAAQVLLGHQRADVTQVYAERDREKALAVIARIG